MLPILRPMPLSARTADSRPGPGPLMRTSMFLTPHSCAARPARSAATCAANGVDLREPLQPALPEVAHDRVLPCRSVMVTMVLLNDAWTCAMPSETFFLTFLRARAEAVCCNSCRVGAFLVAIGDFGYEKLSNFSGGHVELNCFFAPALAGSRARAGALSGHRQGPSLAHGAGGAEIPKPVDLHPDLAAHIAPDGQVLDVLAQAVGLGGLH